MEILAFIAFVLSIIALVKAAGARRRVDELAMRNAALERCELNRVRGTMYADFEARRGAASPPVAPPATSEPTAPPAETLERPALPPAPVPRKSADVPREEPRPFIAPREPEPAPAPRLRINWEQFMGAKLFAWIGGLALFLGVAFFVKYSFERNLIPPEMRVAIGYVIGIGLLVGGVLVKKRDIAVLAQTLCATGVLILYAVTFACRALYHFPFFGFGPTFLLMTLITAVAFVLAVRLDAQVVAVLGMLGGFLTPVLLSTGHDNPWGLFGYIALLDAGLLAVVLHRRWNYLVPLSAAGTVFMQTGWAARFFIEGKYFEGNKILFPMVVLAGFVWLFVGAVFLAARRRQSSAKLTWSGIGLACIAFCFAAFFLSFAPLAQRPILIFGFAFLIDIAVLALVLVESRFATVQPVSGLVVFLLLAAWTANSLTSALLNSALVLYLVFTVFHAAVPLVLQRMRKAALPWWWSQAFPALALLLALGPLLGTTEFSFLLWPFVLLVDLLAIVVAVISATLLPILLVLVLTLVVAGAWILRIPETLTGLPTSLWVLGAFAVFFIVASIWAVRRLAGREPSAGREPNALDALATPQQLGALLPSCSAALPFILLIMVTARLPITNPSPVFGLALLLVVLLLGVAKLLAVDALPLVGLLATLALESSWHFARFDVTNPTIPLAWYLVFYAIFTAFPFVFRKAFADRTLPWAAAALAGPFHFFLVHRLIAAAYPNPVMGLLTAAFAMPSFAALIALLKITPAASPARNGQIAWFGGVALFFITLIFPIQFDRQWITIGWALEGAALCWLFRRIPHSGLRAVGVGLLAIAFARLALNPAVLGYHARSHVAILNWYVYAYGLVAASLFAGAALLAPPRHEVFGKNVRPILAALGTILVFLLVNIEIADYFTQPGASVVTLEFSGDLARDMSYSVAWALFALLLVSIGIMRKSAPVRYAGLGLLSVTLLKLFLHDLSNLDALYRIGALVVVAVVAMFASFLYQRFLATGAKTDENKTPPPPQ